MSASSAQAPQTSDRQASQSSVTRQGAVKRLLDRPRRALHRWAKNRQGTDGLRVELGRKRIYILPTSIGLTYALALFLMLLAAINYANSLAFILTFFLAAAGLVAMHLTHANLSGLAVHYGGADDVFAGDPVRHEWQLQIDSQQARLDIELSFEGEVSVMGDVSPGTPVSYGLWSPACPRGIHKIPRVNIRSKFPLGIFRAWAWIYPARTITVWPRPADSAPTLPLTQGHGADTTGHKLDEEMFDQLREYRAGDTPNRIAWKVLASRDQLATKEFSSGAMQSIELRLSDLREFDTEHALSILSRWIEDCEAMGLRYALDVGRRQTQVGRGPRHRKHCLTTLAEYEASP